jgi:hypothetical protein
MRILSLVCIAALAWLAGEAASAQTADRSIEEIKAETIARARTGAYPLLGIEPADASDALGRIVSRDPDEWAAAWSAVADGYMAKARAAGGPKEADTNFVRAWRLYYFGQWPAPTSSGKQVAYQRAIDAYLQHARNFDPPLEVVRIPYGAKEIVGYLRLPANASRPVPLVLAISGLDSRKETVAEAYAAALPEGIGFFAVDSPGTGQAPLKADETADRMYSRVLDYLATRDERSTRTASSYTARALAPTGRPSSLTRRPGVSQAPSSSRLRSTARSNPIFSAPGCTPASICLTCFRRACSFTA